LIWDETIAEQTDLDALIIINGAYAFCKHLEPVSHAIATAKRIIWVQQDYTIVPPINNGLATSPFRKAFTDRKKAGKSHLEFWTTCQKESKLTPLSSYINWNCLSMTEMILPKSTRPANVVYYGSFRKGREKHFMQFFRFPKVQTIISCPNSKFETYEDPLTKEKFFQSPHIKHCRPPDDLLAWLTQFGAGLYLEDRKSHSEFHSPPNRFYEMLSAGLPILFQQEAATTLWKAGYKNAEYFMVSTPLDVQRKLDNREIIGRKQRDQWHAYAMAERKDLAGKLKQAWEKLQQGA
jgi:hypothetical protein